MLRSNNSSADAAAIPALLSALLATLLPAAIFARGASAQGVSDVAGH